MLTSPTHPLIGEYQKHQRKRELALISCLNFSVRSEAARRPTRPKSVLNSGNSAAPFPTALIRVITFPAGHVQVYLYEIGQARGAYHARIIPTQIPFPPCNGPSDCYAFLHNLNVGGSACRDFHGLARGTRPTFAIFTARSFTMTSSRIKP